jgi:hypothetical protein
MRGDFAAQLEAAKRFNEGRSWDSPDLPLALGDAKAAIRAYAESGEAKELDAIPAVHTTDLDHFRWGSWRANLRTGEVAVLSDAGIVEGRFVRTRQGLAVSMQRIFLLPK